MLNKENEKPNCTNCRHCGGFNDEGYGVGEYICNHPQGDEIEEGANGVCTGWQKTIEKTVEIDGTPYTIKTPADCPFLDAGDNGYGAICTFMYRILKISIMECVNAGGICYDSDAGFPENCPLRDKKEDE